MFHVLSCGHCLSTRPGRDRASWEGMYCAARGLYGAALVVDGEEGVVERAVTDLLHRPREDAEWFAGHSRFHSWVRFVAVVAHGDVTNAVLLEPTKRRDPAIRDVEDDVAVRGLREEPLE